MMIRAHLCRVLIAVAALSLGVCAGASAQAGAPAKQAPSKAPAKAPAKKAAPAAKAAETAKSAPTGRRDPFDPLVNRERGQSNIPDNLPPGPGGLMVSTLRVDGVVRSINGVMIAVISNPQQRVYFLREGARLYDGVIERISMDSVTFRERGKDPFGKPVDRVVTKRIYPRAGEQ